MAIRTSYINTHRTDKTSTFSGHLAVTGNTTITGTCTVTGAFTANGAFTFGDAFADALTVNGQFGFGTGAVSTTTGQYNSLTKVQLKIPVVVGSSTYYVLGYSTAA